MRIKRIVGLSPMRPFNFRSLHATNTLFSNAKVDMRLPNMPPQALDWSCGIHSATRLLNAYGQNVSLDQMINEIGPLSVNLDLINAILKALGLGSSLPSNIQLPVGNRTDYIVQGIQKYEPSAKEQKFTTFECVKKLLANGKPVAALILVGDNSNYSIKFPLLHWIVLAGFNDETAMLTVYRPEYSYPTQMKYSEFLDLWRWRSWQPYLGGGIVNTDHILEFNLYGVLDKLLGRNSIFWIDRTDARIPFSSSGADQIRNNAVSDTVNSMEFIISGDGVTNCHAERAYRDAENESSNRYRCNIKEIYIDVAKFQSTFHPFYDDGGLGGARSCNYVAVVKNYLMRSQIPSQVWIDHEYYGNRPNPFIDARGNGQYGLHFATIYGDPNYPHDAIVVNTGRVTVKKNENDKFGVNIDWTQEPYLGDYGIYFENIYGHTDGACDAIVVNNSGITVRRNTGLSFGPNVDWTNNPYLGKYGTFFANIYGHSDNKVDAIVVNDDCITVRKNMDTSFGPNVSWTSNPYIGKRGTFFANVYGHSDKKVDAIVVNDDCITVRKNMDTSFGSNVSWTNGPYFGTRGTFFANVFGHDDNRVDAIVVNEDSVTVRENTGTSFENPLTWVENLPSRYGSKGVFFANVTNKDRADLILANDDEVLVVPSKF